MLEAFKAAGRETVCFLDPLVQGSANNADIGPHFFQPLGYMAGQNITSSNYFPFLDAHLHVQLSGSSAGLPLEEFHNRSQNLADFFFSVKQIDQPIRTLLHIF